MSRASRLYWRMTFAVQNCAVFFSAASGFVLDPCILSSLNAATHWSLESDGGGGGRNCPLTFLTNGLTDPTHGVCGIAYALGVSRHTPGLGTRVGNDDVEVIGVTSPSPVRSAISFAAAAAPSLIPRSFAEPLGIAASASACWADSVAACAGK